MNKLLRNSVIIAYVILVSISFLSCKKTSEIKKNKTQTLVAEKKFANNVDEKITYRNPIVFITGYDKGNQTYYKNARAYFKEKKYQLIENQYSLEEIINWLNNNMSNYPYGEIHIVNKSIPFKGMTLETTINGDKVTTESLKSNINKGTLPILKDCVKPNSKIIFHANGLAENKELMMTLKDAFCAKELPNVIASSYFTIFNGEFSKHYLAQPYYVFYPTAKSPGKVDLSKEISKKYPKEKEIDWLDALYNYQERFVGDAYSKQFTIPVKFILDYHNSDDEIPTFKLEEELMDFIEQKEELYTELKTLNIPLEKFRWTWNVKNSKLTIKGKTTGIIILKPLIKPYGELDYILPDTNNKRLYAMK